MSNTFLFPQCKNTDPKKIKLCQDMIFNCTSDFI